MSADLAELVPFLRQLPNRRGRRRVTQGRPPELIAIERSYAARIRALLRELGPTVAGSVAMIASELGAQPRSDGWRSDRDKPGQARSIVKQLEFGFLRPHLHEMEQVAVRGLITTAQHGKLEAGALAQVLRVNPLKTEPGVKPELERAVSRNVKLIRSIPERYFDALETELVEGVEAGRTADTIAARLRKGFGSEEDDAGQLAIAMRRAGLIARDQVGKLHGDLTKIRQSNLGITRYRWRTSRDERVRGNPSGRYPDSRYSHHDREGEIFEWDDPPEDGAPGEAPLCRCIAEPVLEDLLEDVSLVEEDEPEAEFSFDPLAFAKETLGPSLTRAARPPRPPGPPPPPRPIKPAIVLAPARPGPMNLEPLAGALEQTIVRKSHFDIEPVKKLPPDIQAKVRNELNGVVNRYGFAKPKALAGHDKFEATRKLPRKVTASYAETGEIRAQPIITNRAALFARGDRASESQDGMQALIHETVHAHSPLAASGYTGAGMWIEEVTTEVAARRIAADLGADRFAPGVEAHGAYQRAILRVRTAMKDTLGIENAAANEAIERASFEMRKVKGVHITRPDDYVDHFVTHLGVGNDSGALSARLKADLNTWDGK